MDNYEASAPSPLYMKHLAVWNAGDSLGKWKERERESRERDRDRHRERQRQSDRRRDRERERDTERERECICQCIHAHMPTFILARTAIIEENDSMLTSEGQLIFKNL